MLRKKKPALQRRPEPYSLRGEDVPEEDVPDVVRLGREMAAKDPVVFQAAQGAVESWLERYPDIAQAAGESDNGATSASLILLEAYAAAGAAKDAAQAGESAEAIFNEVGVPPG